MVKKKRLILLRDFLLKKKRLSALEEFCFQTGLRLLLYQLTITSLQTAGQPALYISELLASTIM